MAISSNIAIVGAYLDDVGSNSNQGSAYVFVQNEPSWSQQAQLIAIDGAPQDVFGNSVAISKDTAVVGAELDSIAYLGREGSAYIFGSGATQPVSIRDPQGNQTNLTYTHGITLTITDAKSGRFLNLTHDAQGRLVKVTDNAGRVVQYGYDIDNNLAVVTDTRGLAWTYAYTSASLSAGSGNHYLHTVIDPDGKIVEKTFFDSQGRATRQENGLANPLVQITYNSGNRVVNEAGKVMTDTYNGQNLWIGTLDAQNQALTYTLDGSFNRTSSADAKGNPPTQYARTPMGLTTHITDALGFTTVFTYDGRNNLTTISDALGTTTSYTYDTQNNLKTATTVSGTTSYTYNSAGQVIEMRDERNNLTRYGYDTLGNRTVITNALNQVTRYQYDSLGRVVTTTDALNKATVNTYDAASNLIKVTENYLAGQPQNHQNQYNLITSYAYDGAGRQTAITDTLGRVTQNIYNNAGQLFRVIENKHPSITTQNHLNEYNLIMEYGYDGFGRQIAITDTLGRVTRTEYNTLGQVSKTIINYQNGVYSASKPDEDIITSYQYDANGNLIRETDTLGRVAFTGYDALNRVSQSVENYINGVFNSSYPDEDLVTGYTYDAVGNQVTVTDTLGRVTTSSYDKLNRVISVTDPLNGVTRYSYDATDNRLTVTDANTHTTTYAYDALNRVVTTTNALGGQTMASYDAVGNRRVVIDANGRPLTYTYDSLYRLISMTNAANEISSYSYDALGNKLTETDAEGRVTRYGYDGLNRVISMTNALNGTTLYTYDALGNKLTETDPLNHTTSYTYDKLNRLTHIQTPQSQTQRKYDGLGNLLNVINGANQTTTFDYDAANRLEEVQDPLGNQTNYGYDGLGNRVRQTDPAGVKTRYYYDALNRLIKVIENHVDGTFNSSKPDEDVITLYEYDKVGNRTKLTNGRGYITAYTYDALDRQTEIKDPLNQTTHYGYDLVGNRTVITDALAQTTVFTYNVVDRLTTINYPGSTPDVSFIYNKLGHKLTMVDGTGTTTYTYDSLYRLTATRNGAGQLVSYGYDAAGNRTRLTYPDGKVITYTYDTANRLATVTDWASGVYSYTYDAADRLVGLKLPNNLTSTYSYDAAGRLTRLTHSLSAGDLAIYAYNLDVLGNRKRVTETLVTPSGGSLGGFNLIGEEESNNEPPAADEKLGQLTAFLYLPLLLKDSRLTPSLNPPSSPFPTPDPQALTPGLTLYLPFITNQNGSPFAAGFAGPAVTQTIVYTYDKLYHLTNANYLGSGTYAYSYDPVGNRKSQVALGQTTVYTYDAANRLTNAGSQAYTWNANGNLLNTGVLTNVFDAADRLITTTRALTTLQVKYNGLNDRVQQTVGVSTTNYALDVATDLPEVISTTNGTAYLHLPGVIMAQNASGQRVYLLSDGLGSIRQVISGTTLVAQRNFDPYGNPTGTTAFADPYGFTGEWWEKDVKLLHLRARWYDAQNGIFLSKDAWQGDYERPQTLNGWNYVEGNPVNRIDPSGQVVNPPSFDLNCLIYGINLQTGRCRTGSLPPLGAATYPSAIGPQGALVAAVVILGLCLLVVSEQLVENLPETLTDPAPQSQSRPATTPIPPPFPVPTPTRDYQVRVQIQGKQMRVGEVGISRTLRDNSPIKASAVILALDTLFGSLSRTDKDLVDQAYDKAKIWVSRVAAAGGVGPIQNRPFFNRGINPKDARVDIEIERGEVNLIP